MNPLSLRAPCSTGMLGYKEWKDSKAKVSKERQKKARQEKWSDTLKQPRVGEDMKIGVKPIEAMNH